MNKRFALLFFFVCLWTAASALAFTDLKGDITTTEKNVYHADSFRNLRYSFHCYYDDMERYLPIEDITRIEHTGSKNLGASSLFTLKPSVEKVRVSMKNGQTIEAFMQPGYKAFQELVEGSEGKLYFTYHDTLTGKMQEMGLHFDKIKALDLR